MKCPILETPWWVEWLIGFVALVAFAAAIGIVVLSLIGYATFVGIRRFLRSELVQHTAVLDVAPGDPVDDGYRPLLQRRVQVGYGMAPQR